MVVVLLYVHIVIYRLLIMISLAFRCVMLVSLCGVVTLNMRILCVMKSNPNKDSLPWEGYWAKSTPLPGLPDTQIDLVVALPQEWHDAPCCHRIELVLQGHQLLNARDEHMASFVPFIEWRLCSPNLSDILCYVHSFVTMEMRSLVTSLSTWRVVIDQCLMPQLSSVTYVVSVYSNMYMTNWSNVPKTNGTVQVTDSTISGLNIPQMDVTTMCVFQGGLRPSRSDLSHLATIKVNQRTSLRFSFTFVLHDPSNQEIFNVVFENDGAGFTPADHGDLYCDGTGVKSEPALSRPTQKTPPAIATATTTTTVGTPAISERWTEPAFEPSWRFLRLSISDPLSGCEVLNEQGKPTYSCEGGRSFPAPAALSVSVLSCYRTTVNLNYTLSFLNYEGHCPPSNVHPLDKANTAHTNIHANVLVSIILPVALVCTALQSRKAVSAYF